MTESFRQSSAISRSQVIGSLLRATGVSLVIGVLLGLLGPFGTYESMPLAQRMTFWMLTIMVGMMVHLPLYWLGAWIGQEWRVSPIIWVPVSAMIAAAPMTLLVNGVAAALFGDIALDSFIGLYPLVLVISLPAQVITHFTSRQFGGIAGLPIPEPQAQPAPDVATPMPTAPSLEPMAGATLAPATAPFSDNRLFAALPVRIGRDVVCLQMEDHYLRVLTTKGDAMIYMKMGDAEALLADAIEGMRVHRSWWVARQAVTGWTRDGKTLSLTLSNGQVVPVARDRQPLVKAAGWLA